MNEQLRLRVGPLFTEASDLPEEERAAFLAAACQGDPLLRAEVESLLAYDSSSGAEDDEGFLKSPLVREPDETLSDFSPSPLSARSVLPSHIGRYRILAWHGEGGMGTVYEAEQDNPRRTVALKVIRSGFVSPEVFNRFRHEAQILARLQHFGIAQVYEAGVSEDGRPFFAMEFIRGQPLDEYVRTHNIGSRACLELIAKVCDAVQHAHDKGVVHRDLKPGNIMVDLSGSPKVLDFGVAHVTDVDLMMTSSQTQTGQLLGTLGYMSPEQLAARPSGLDGRSDVYTLGVILFELLAHRLPYHLDSLPMHEVARVIDQQEPMRLGSIDRRYRGDVEIIVAKALEKEKTRRYASAGDLASDIRRYLRGEPIVARQVGTALRYWRWARRNPSISVLAGVLAGVLVIATMGSLLAARRFAIMAEREHQLAMGERIARERADEASQAAEAARSAAQDETYRAVLSEVKALRFGHQLGWREKALAELARLAVMPTPRRDLVELRSEAVASIGAFEVTEVARFHGQERLRETSWSATSIDISPDSKQLVAANKSGVIDLWNIPDGTRITRIAAREPATGEPLRWRPGRVCFLSDSGLAYIDTNARVCFLDGAGQPSARPAFPGRSASASRLASDREGHYLAVGWSDGQIGLHDAKSGALLRNLKGNIEVAFSPDCQWIAHPGVNNTIELEALSGRGAPVSIGHHSKSIKQLAFSPDGGKVASFSERSIVLWDIQTNTEMFTWRLNREDPTAFALSPEGGLIAVTCADHTTRIFDLADGHPLAVISGPWFMRALAFSRDGQFLAASADPGPVCLYELKGLRQQRRLSGHTHGVQRVAFHPRLPQLASSSDDHDVIVWDALKGQELRRWTPNPVWVTGLAYSSDGALIASTPGHDDRKDFDFSICLWEADSGRLRKRLPGNTAGVWALAFDPNSRRIASGDSDGVVMLFDVAGGQILFREKLENSPVLSIAFHDEGRYLLAGHRDGTIGLLDVEKTDARRRYKSPQGCGRLTVDGRRNRAILGDNEGAIISLSLPDLTVLNRKAGAHVGAIESIALSPDGRMLATGGNDRRVVIRDPITFEAMFTFPEWTSVVKDLAFDSSGRWLAYGGADLDVDLWDLTLVFDELAELGLFFRPAAEKIEQESR